MAAHDWTRVVAGIFHDFHLGWIQAIKIALNDGLLPADYYALSEQVAGEFGPDVLALRFQDLRGDDLPVKKNGINFGEGNCLTAVATAPPRVRFTAQTEMDQYVRKQRSVVIRHSSGDEVVALIEVVSPGNKSSRHALQSFVFKAAETLSRGYHLTVLDLQPPTGRDPHGIHGAIWEEIADDTYRAPTDKPLTLASYDAGDTKTAYVEPFAVGDELPDMPLFLQPGEYVSVPLEQTYQSAFAAVPERWRRVLVRK